MIRSSYRSQNLMGFVI